MISMKKKIVRIVTFAFMAALFGTAAFNTEKAVAEVITKSVNEIMPVQQDITQPITKSYTLSESMNSIWIPVNAEKKGIVNFACKAEGNTENVYIALYTTKDVNAEREYNIINGEEIWNMPLSVIGTSYIYIEKGINDRGKSVTVTISTSFSEEVIPAILDSGEKYNIVQAQKNQDYKFVVKKPQKITFNVDYSRAYLLDSKKNICSNDVNEETVYLDKGTYYLRITDSGIHTVTYTSNDASLKNAVNTKKKKAKTIELDENLYFIRKKTANKELWYKIKSNTNKKISFTCSYDGAMSGNYVKSLTSYNSRGKKIQNSKSDIVKTNKGTNYIKVCLSSEAKAGILNIVASEVYEEFSDDITDNEINCLENCSSLYAKKIIKDSYVVDSYSKYTKLLKQIKKRFEKEYNGFKAKNDEFYKTLKAYDKSFFRKNSLCIYSCDVSESRKMTDSPKFKVLKVDGNKQAQLSVARQSYSGGLNEEAVSYYFVNVEKSKLKGVDTYEVVEKIAAARNVSESDKQRSKWISPFYEVGSTIPVKATVNAISMRSKWMPENGAVVISTYSQYKKFIENNGSETDDCLKDYDKSYFKKNNLVLYTYMATDSGLNARGVYLTKENVNGIDTLVCSFVGYPYYGGGSDTVVEYCYAVQVSKKEANGIKNYVSRRVAMFEK